MFPIRDTIPSRTIPVVTWILILANASAFFFELDLSDAQLRNLFFLFGIVPARFSHLSWANVQGLTAPYWPFLTSLFLHGGWMHLISNMWMLWIFGDNVEDRMGHLRFLAFYLLCGIAAGLVQFFTNPGSMLPTVGASGAIAGVMGAYLLLYPSARVVTLIPVFFYPLFVEIPAVLFLVVWFYSQLFSGLASLSGPDQLGGIAWWAHVGGFLTGAILRFIFVRRSE